MQTKESTKNIEVAQNATKELAADAVLNDAAIAALSTEQLEAILAKKKAEQIEQANKLRSEYEALKETTVVELSRKANALNHALKTFKELAFEEMNTLYDLLKEYSNRHTDGKGNFQLDSADGLFRIRFKNQKNGYFDERSIQAEAHIKDFLSSRYSGDVDTKDIIMSLLERKRGSLDIQLVQRLYAMENRFDNDNWKEGIKLLKESWQLDKSKDYITFHIRDEHGVFQLINLNFASV
ncbi:DUF3164 family protein [Solitalea koreensis]|uniref:DUF3164 family protein n=1 Tax=Solitalea koreensis TaxID=543615 RepID=A0A521BMK0_9SPHI|nr:DUF3164 family protein [Solitalea koreensis]SMO48335.1 Protein of unknown function [Solitalea koreensis]